MLIKGMLTEMTASTAPPVLSEVTGGLRSIMREVVTQSTATSLATQGELHGKTGIAEYSPAGSHG